MYNESYSYEDLYFNYFEHDKPVRDSLVRIGIWDKKTREEEFQKAISDPNIKFIYNGESGWSKELAEDLKKLY